MTVIDKMKLESMDIAEDKIKQLKAVFPEVFSDGKIDFEKLRLVLGEEIDEGKERYGLNWAGKADCLRLIQKPTIATLKPCREESVDFDKTEPSLVWGEGRL